MITQQLDGGVVLDAEHMQLDELSAEHFGECLGHECSRGEKRTHTS